MSLSLSVHQMSEGMISAIKHIKYLVNT